MVIMLMTVKVSTSATGRLHASFAYIRDYQDECIQKAGNHKLDDDLDTTHG